MKNIKVGDVYECINDWEDFTIGKTYPINKILTYIHITDDCGHDRGFCLGVFNKNFRPAPQKYMCVMGRDDRELYLSPHYESFMIMINTDTLTQFDISDIDVISNRGYELITVPDFMQKFPPPSKEVEFVKGEEYVSKLNTIVLCTENGTSKGYFSGTCIHESSYFYGVGHHSESWGTESFKPLNK